MLLTRLPLTPKDAFDLHVLSLPPAFVLSQDQTLKLKDLISTISLRKLTETYSLTSVSTKRDVAHQNVDRSMSSRSVHKTDPQGHRRPRFSFFLHLSKSNAPKAPEENSDQHRNNHSGPSRLNTSERTKHRGAPSMKMVYSRPSSVSTADQNFFQRSVYSFCRHLIRASIHARKERKFLAG